MKFQSLCACYHSATGTAIAETHLTAACPTQHSLIRAELSTSTRCKDVPKLEAGYQFRAECPQRKSALSKSCETSATDRYQTLPQDQRPSCHCCNTTPPTIKPRQLNSITFTGASFISSKVSIASSGSNSFLYVPFEDGNLSSGASSVAAHAMKRR
ncbi:hypothetical protein T11_6062 [Trichinella zimbabwensis]|uniref:Uncharacterized protein n=1 Tax=Trichinella zimbabwensis TaxID=268475 RepID=A0A0V1HJM6_9BILA|nr:hypothetical protein T11_6062 [Trichinella zimbabwensis]